MSNVSFRIEGLNEAYKQVADLSDKMQHKVLVAVQKKAAQPIARLARSLVRKNSKRVATSIKTWELKKTEFPLVFVGPRFSKDRTKDPWFAHMIEGGTQGIKKSAGGKMLKPSTEGSIINIRSILKKGKNGTRYRNDSPARPFMAPAIQSNIQRAGEIMQSEVGKIIDRELNKSKS